MGNSGTRFLDAVLEALFAALDAAARWWRRWRAR